MDAGQLSGHHARGERGRRLRGGGGARHDGERERGPRRKGGDSPHLTSLARDVMPITSRRLRVTFIAMALTRVPALLCLALAFGLAADAIADAPRSRSSRRRRVASARPRPPALPALVVPASASARDLQVGEACRRGLEGTSGAVVAMDPYTGRVMALVNPQRGMATAYQPCSVFKIVVAIAGLTEGVITPESTYNCTGGCWIWPGHGVLNLRQALGQSCHPYFQWVGG